MNSFYLKVLPGFSLRQPSGMQTPFFQRAVHENDAIIIRYILCMFIDYQFGNLFGSWMTPIIPVALSYIHHGSHGTVYVGAPAL